MLTGAKRSLLKPPSGYQFPVQIDFSGSTVIRNDQPVRTYTGGAVTTALVFMSAAITATTSKIGYAVSVNSAVTPGFYLNWNSGTVRFFSYNSSGVNRDNGLFPTAYTVNQYSHVLAFFKHDAATKVAHFKQGAGAWATFTSTTWTGANDDGELTNTTGYSQIGGVWNGSSVLSPIDNQITRVAVWTNVTADPTSSTELAYFSDNSGNLVDPSVSHAVYGTPMIDLYGEAKRWNDPATYNDGDVGGNWTAYGATPLSEV